MAPAPRSDPSSREPPRCGAAAKTREARRENGRLCSQTVPGPVTLAKNRPSPPNRAVLILPTYWISKLTFDVSATMQPVSTSSVWPGRQLALQHRAAGVHEGQAVAVELLHDESLAAEEADREALLEEDAEGDAARRAQERVLLADQRAAELPQVHRQDLAGVRRGERDALLAARRRWCRRS